MWFTCDLQTGLPSFFDEVKLVMRQVQIVHASVQSRKKNWDGNIITNSYAVIFEQKNDGSCGKFNEANQERAPLHPFFNNSRELRFTCGLHVIYKLVYQAFSMK